MRRFLCTVLFSLLTIIPVFSLDEKSVFGIVEFDQKNSIGLENAGLIIPEILIVQLKKISDYRFVERVLLKKALAEQELQMGGTTDEKAIARIGKVHNLNGIITGSYMMIGKIISVSGRIIDTETAEIFSSGTVEFNAIEDLGLNLEKLAYLLVNKTEADYERIKLEEEFSLTSVGMNIGTACMIHSGPYMASYNPLAGGLSFSSRYFDVDFYGIPPILNEDALISLTFNVNPIPFIGFGAGYQYYYESVSWRANYGTNLTAYRLNGHKLLLGVDIRATRNLRANLYYGLNVAGVMELQAGGTTNTYEINDFKYFNFPNPSIAFSVEVQISRENSLNFILTGHSGRAGDPNNPGYTSPFGCWMFIVSYGDKIVF